MAENLYYHYYGGSKFNIDDILSERVALNHVSSFNDPCEIALLSDEGFRYLYEWHFRAFCFSKTYLNAHMWGHYGNSNRGFCAGYDCDDIVNIPEYKDRLMFEKIKYVDTIPSLSDNEIKKGLALYYKNKGWDKEKEFRTVIFLHDKDIEFISKNQFEKTREERLKTDIDFESIIDWNFAFISQIQETTRDSVISTLRRHRKTQNWFIHKEYEYCELKSADGKTKFGRLPLRVYGTLRPKVIYLGLKTPDDTREKLKEYAKKR